MSRDRATAGPVRFATTRWSVVLEAADGKSTEASRALEQLCQSYWMPLYSYIRRSGHDATAAKDLTQAFFEDLLERHALGRIDRGRGKFRSFLIASLNHFLRDEWARSRTLKRGGGREIFSIDAVPAEEFYQYEPMDEETPEKVFERRWAQTVLHGAIMRLSTEWAEAGLGERFEVLKEFLMGDAAGGSYEDAAKRLGVTLAAVTSAIHRLRTRFREVFREEIVHTVATPSEVDEEIRYLASIL